MANYMNFEEMRALVQESDRGKVMDSLICVEVGLESYKAWWDAHNDIREEVSEKEAEDGEVLLTFLMDMGEIIDFASVDFDRVMESANA